MVKVTKKFKHILFPVFLSLTFSALLFSLSVRQQQEIQTLKSQMLYFNQPAWPVSPTPTPTLTPTPKPLSIKLFFHNSEIDPQVLDTTANDYKIVQIPYTSTPLTEAINLLINEFRMEDRDDYKQRVERFSLVKVSIDNGVATLEFTDPLLYTSGGSTRLAILYDRIIKTALQFKTVKQVNIIGAEFQP